MHVLVLGAARRWQLLLLSIHFTHPSCTFREPDSELHSEELVQLIGSLPRRSAEVAKKEDFSFSEKLINSADGILKRN